MDLIENVIHRTNGSPTEIHKFSDTLRCMRGKCSKRILTYLYCIKYNETNMRQSNVQKHAPYTGSHKRFMI